MEVSPSYTVQYRTASQINTAMLGVYNHMALAVITSMIVAMLAASSAAFMSVVWGTALKWVVIFAPLALCFIIPPALNSGISRTGKIALLHLFATTMGLSMSALMAVFTGASIVSAFMGAAVLFGTMSFWGYFTKRSLEGWGQFLFVGLIAIIVASLVNMVMASFWPGVIDNSVVSQVISAIAVLIFTALTAYDTQRIREQLMTDSSDSAELTGALSLYLNFINIFTSLLQLFGIKNDD